MRTIKILALILIPIMLIIFISCAGKEPADSQTVENADVTEQEETIDEVTPAATPDPEETQENLPASLPESWHPDITIMPGLELYSGDFPECSTTHENSESVFLKGNVDDDEVLSYYNKLPGWSISRIGRSDRYSCFGVSKSKGIHHLDVDVFPRDDGIYVRLNYSRD